MLTMAVFAIVITAPLGAIFINTLGPRWLECHPNLKVGGDTVELADSEAAKGDGTETAKVSPDEA